MKVTSQSKKGISEIIAYVLLISITLTLSVIVYGWLKGYLCFGNTCHETCSEEVSLVVESYKCISPVNGNDGNLTLILKNKGLFDINKFILRVSDQPNATFGTYTLTEKGDVIEIGETYTRKYPLTGVGNLTYLDIQPYVNGKKNALPCKITALKIICT